MLQKPLVESLRFRVKPVRFLILEILHGVAHSNGTVARAQYIREGWKAPRGGSMIVTFYSIPRKLFPAQME